MFQDISEVMFVCLYVFLGMWIVLRVKQRLELSLAKQPGLGGHLRWAKRIAGWIPNYSYSQDVWFSTDHAPFEIANLRKSALTALGNRMRDKAPLTLAHTQEVKPMISDLQFISQYRVPYQFKNVLTQYLQLGSFWKSSDGVYLNDMDGNRYIDVTGSYGVNLLGQDFYKECVEEGVALVKDLGPVLGSYHPCVLDNVQRLCAISNKDEVSFHMSGTEAVMQAVRLARYHTGKRKLVRFAGAYHGWWDDVQPGPGNPMPPSDDTLTLRDMHDSTLRVLNHRNDIACVLINPLQGLHPSQAAPTDSTLVDGKRFANFDRKAYTQWLQQLREVCTRKGIALIFDEVFLGFRLAKGGAQAYFGIDADLVTYGKTLGGGLPVGVICGKKEWMKRFNDEKPVQVCFARGTFNASPYVMGSMNVFLKRLDTKPVQDLYDNLDATWETRLVDMNQRLAEENLPVRVAGMSTVWTVLYQTPSRYNWLLQYYLRDQGIALSWIGTGRMIFSLNFTQADFQSFVEQFVQAAHHMERDQWWWVPEGQTNQKVRRAILKEVLREKFT
jgi:glutamate-1-semialdehyde 2,1-aminomutase